MTISNSLCCPYKLLSKFHNWPCERHNDKRKQCELSKARSFKHSKTTSRFFVFNLFFVSCFVYITSWAKISLYSFIALTELCSVTLCYDNKLEFITNEQVKLVSFTWGVDFRLFMNMYGSATTFLMFWCGCYRYDFSPSFTGKGRLTTYWRTSSSLPRLNSLRMREARLGPRRRGTEESVKPGMSCSPKNVSMFLLTQVNSNMNSEHLLHFQLNCHLWRSWRIIIYFWITYKKRKSSPFRALPIRPEPQYKFTI